MSVLQHIDVIDSHTGGEPTRVVVASPIDLGEGPLPQRVARFREQFDHFRSAIVNEPRGSDVMVGALLLPPTDPECAGAVIFFNNVGYLGMCGHGMIGAVVTLAHLGRIGPGQHRLETPAGTIAARLHDDGRVSVSNVASYRLGKDIKLRLDGGILTGDIAYGGNWFFITQNHGQTLMLENVERLTDFTTGIRRALRESGITGANGAEIDHIELTAPSPSPRAHARNFVLCPGNAYDRSPCGTGTSAKLACLYADGKLAPGETWVQESITGSTFEGSIAIVQNKIIPTITGRAFVNAEARLILDPADPLCWGIRRT